MRAPVKAAGPFTLTVPDAAAAAAVAALGRETRYLTVEQENPIEQDGQKFRFLVLPVVCAGEATMTQAGAGVLCQTQAEAVP
jgi:hypothetical protein